MNLNGSFGNWLRQRRKALDLTQADLADQVGCSKIMIRKIESDERRPSRQISERMADVLAIALEDRAAFLNFARRMNNTRSHLLDDLIPTINLPPQTTPFIGRETELAQIADRLNDPTCRLLTLVGPGGIGKTRLALQAAANYVGKFTDGVFFVSLTPVGSTTLISAAIASALQVSFYGQETPDAQIVNYLRGKHVLLVLDNYEHLLGGIGLLADLLANAPRVKLLVTSRERLNMQEEWALPVAGLPFPNQDTNRDANTGSYDAVQLFVHTARRIEPGFSLAGNEGAVADICRAVEGMPLGLELAATWLRVMPCSHIAGQIRRDLDFLATPLRNVAERHRSLRVVFEHSWSLLSEAECNVVMKLSVFRGGCDLEAAEQVAGASLWLLAGLVDKSLVRLNPVGRYEMHELLRQFAADKLLEAGQLDKARHHHLQFFLQLSELLEAHLFGPHGSDSLDHLEIEHDNFRAALDWAFQVRDAESGLRLSGGLGWFWQFRAPWNEGGAWLDKFLRMDINVSLSIRARALFHRIEFSIRLDDDKTIEALCDQALKLASELEDLKLKAWLLSGVGHVGYFWSPLGQTFLEDALNLFRQIGDQWGICETLCRLARYSFQRGDFAQADVLQEEGIVLARQAGDKSTLSFLLMLSACKNWYAGKIDKQTESLYHESLGLFGELRNKNSIHIVLNCLGKTAYLRGDVEGAWSLFEQSLLLSQQVSSNVFTVINLISLAEVFSVHDEPEQGARILGAISDSVASIFVGPLFTEKETRMDYARSFDAARAKLGEAAFNAAFAEGKHMSLEQAAAYALSDAAFAETVSMLRDLDSR